MAIRTGAAHQLQKLLGREEAREVLRLAAAHDVVETYWRSRLNRLFTLQVQRTIDEFERDEKPRASMDWELFLEEQSLSVAREALKELPVTSGKENDPALQPAPLGFHLSKKPPAGKTPRSFKDLMEMWDRWRKTGNVGRRQRILGKRIEKEYLKRVQSVWEQHGEAFREGDDATRAEVVRKLKDAAGSAYARAKMTVETETTYYYNKTRRDVYDSAPDVTHYLFIAVRDHATTAWCRSRNGLVYEKGDPLLDKETPPCHWNCRSEILPLTPLNARHLALIEDPGLRRRNNVCVPLPRGWTAR